MTLGSTEDARTPKATPAALAQSMVHAGIELKPSEIAAASTDKATKVQRASTLVESMEASKMPTWLLPLSSLGPNLHEASELAAVLEEVSPHIHVDARHPGMRASQGARTPTTPSLLTSQWNQAKLSHGARNIHDRSVIF